MPRGIELIGGELTRERVRVCTRLEDGLDGADVVMMLRVQHERFEGEAPRFPNTRELSRTFGLSERTLALRQARRDRHAPRADQPRRRGRRRRSPTARAR